MGVAVCVQYMPLFLNEIITNKKKGKKKKSPWLGCGNSLGMDGNFFVVRDF